MSMQLFGSDMFRAMDRLWEQMEEALREPGPSVNIRSGGRGFPPLNVGTTDDSIEIVAFAPGLDATTLDVSVDRGLLTISGERTSSLKDLPEGTTVYARERPFGKFWRAVQLPRDADPEQVEAQYTDGCLCIRIKKSESSKPRPVLIQ